MTSFQDIPASRGADRDRSVKVSVPGAAPGPADRGERAEERSTLLNLAEYRAKDRATAISPEAMTRPRPRMVRRNPAKSDSVLLTLVLSQGGDAQAVSDTPGAGPVPARAATPDANAPAHLAPVEIGDRSDAVDWTLPGFEGHCRVPTNFGDLPIHALRLRDMVRTQTGFRPVKWIDQVHLDADFMQRHADAHPIYVAARSLGANTPKTNILVSPGQTLRLNSDHTGSTMVRAIDLLGRRNIHRKQVTEITYYRFHLGERALVNIEGAMVSITPGR